MKPFLSFLSPKSSIDMSDEKYASLANDDENEDEIDSGSPVAWRQSRRGFHWKSALGGFAIATIALAAVATASWVMKRQLGDTYVYTDCGSTPEEARSRGCHYEPMQRAWIPPECYFEEPSDEYDVFRDRVWYQDTNLTIPADVEGLESGDVLLAYTRHWHDEHCTYVLRKLALAVEMGKTMINSKPANIHHSNHCSHTIANRIVNSYNESFLAYDRSMTESNIIFEKCVPLPVSLACGLP
jgi:hypothetical protein